MTGTVEAEASSNTPGSRPRFLSEAVALSLLGGFIYALAFVYEAGYFGAFGVPLHLIQTNVDAVFVLAITVGTALFVVFGVINMIAIFWPEHPIIQMKIVRVTVLLFLVMWPGLLYGFTAVDRMVILVAVLILVLLEVAWPVFVYRKRPTLAKRFEADESAENPIRARTLFGRLQLAAGPLAYGVALGGYLVLVLAHSAGRAEAMRKEEFFFLQDDPRWLVVRVYPSQIVAVLFDSSSGAIQPELIVRPIDAAGVRLVKKQVGPLKLRQSGPARKEP